MTRMWMIEPSLLCRQHLLGEHNEIHKAIGGLKKGRSIRGHLENKNLAPQYFRERHNELVEEMKKRNYNHQSSLPEEFPIVEGEVDKIVNLLELYMRCGECRERMRGSINLK